MTKDIDIRLYKCHNETDNKDGCNNFGIRAIDKFLPKKDEINIDSEQPKDGARRAKINIVHGFEIISSNISNNTSPKIT